MIEMRQPDERGDQNHCALREEPSQINVILQQKLLVANFSAVCSVYYNKTTRVWCAVWRRIT